MVVTPVVTDGSWGQCAVCVEEVAAVRGLDERDGLRYAERRNRRVTWLTGVIWLFGGRWHRGLLPELIRILGEAAGRDQVVPLRPDVLLLSLAG